MLQLEDKVTVYLLNSKGRALSNENVTGDIVFVYTGETSVEAVLISRGDDHFITTLDRTDAFNAVVTLRVKGKSLTVNFEYAGLNTDNLKQSLYTCPMHPEIQSSTSGPCPKCGMELEK